MGGLGGGGNSNKDENGDCDGNAALDVGAKLGGTGGGGTCINNY